MRYKTRASQSQPEQSGVMSSPETSRWGSTRWLKWAPLCTLAVVGPMLLGGALPWAAACVAVASLAAAAASASRGAFGRLASTHVWWLLAACFVWTAIQLAPLPCTLVSWLSYTSAELQTTAALALDADEPLWCSITMDPGGTRESLVVHAGYVFVFAAAYLHIERNGRRGTLQLVAISTALMAVVAWGHQLAAAAKLFGVYEPLYASPRLLAPLLNDNNLAGFLVMGTPVAVGLGIEEEQRDRRFVWFAIAALLASTVVFTLSRGGIAALALSLLLMAGLRSKKAELSRGRLTAVAIVGCAIAAAVFAASGAVEREFASKGYDKFYLLREGLGFALASPLVGVGRGAWSAAFVHEYGMKFRFEHAENLVAQWGAEWGIPFALVASGALVFATLRGRIGRTSALTGGAVGLVAVAVHNLVDFGLELPGVATLAIILVAAVATSRPRVDPKPALRLPAGAVAVGAAATIVFFAGSLQDNSRRQLETSLSNSMRTGDRAGFQRALRKAVLLHPAEPGFALLAGAEAARRNDPSAALWLNRAMRLAPQWTEPHIEAARWLSRTGRMDQAMLELREATERDAASARVFLCDLVKQTSDPQLVLRASPPGEAGLDVIENAAGCMPPGENADLLHDYILSRDPARPVTRLRVAIAMLDEQPARAASTLEVLAGEYPAIDETHEYWARALLKLQRPVDAVAVLDRVSARANDPVPLVSLRARAATAAAKAASGERSHWTEEMRSSIRELRGLSGGDPVAAARAELLHGELETELRNPLRALDAHREACRLLADDSEHPRTRELAHRRLASSAMAVGQDAVARDANQVLCELNPTSEHDYCGQANAARMNTRVRPGN